VANSTAFLAALPIGSIDPSPEILAILVKWGIRTLGEFTLLGRDAIAERLCSEGLELFERASAGAGRPLRLSTPPEIFEEVKEFEPEIESLEPLLFILRRFVDQLAPRLELAGMMAAELRLGLRLASGELHQRQLKIPAPTREASVLFRILHTYLETVRTDQPVVAVSLRAIPSREVGQQFRLFEIALRDPNQFFETLARLVALVGSDRVGTPVMESTHRPDAFRLQSITWDAPQESGDKAQGVPRSSVGLVLRRFRPPIQALVNFQEGRPRAVRSSRFSDGLEQAEGPWRSSGDWWDEQPWTRDEWDVRTCRGELYRLYCEREQWFIEGVYD
jgi:protein ImuB